MCDVTLCINEPCLKGRAYKRFRNSPGGQGSPSRAARRSGRMLQRDAQIRSGGTRARSRQGQSPAAILRERKLFHQDSFTGFPSPLQALYKPIQRQLHPRPYVPCSTPEGRRWGGHDFSLPQSFRPALTAASWLTVLPGRSRWAGSGGQRLPRFLREAGLETQVPGSKAGSGVLRLLGSISCCCRRHAAGWTHQLNKRTSGDFLSHPPLQAA